MANDEPVGLIASKLTLIGADGRRMVLTPDGFTVDGGHGRGSISAEFDGDGAAMLALYTKDMQSSACLLASDDSAGILLRTGAKNASLASSGLEVSNPDRQRITLTDLGLTVRSADGEILFAIPFSPADAKAFIFDALSRLGGRLKAALSVLTAPTE